VRLAIQKNLREFIAVIVMVILALIVGGYILSNQRFYLPAWVPVLGTDFFELKGEFSTAQSVTPGQGQTVNIAGVAVGEIKAVDLVDGRAVVTMSIRQKYADMIKPDATMLLRPKTGLKDMVIEMDPGTQTVPAVKEGYTIPVEQTQPDVNLDEILASLDRDTRDYLRLLIAGGGEGLKNNGRAFANAFRRFEPLSRDTRKLTGELSKRRTNLARLRAIVEHPAFAAGELNTGFIEEHLAELTPRPCPPLVGVAALAAALQRPGAGATAGAGPADRAASDPWASLGPWRIGKKEAEG